ncbi:tRNA (N(6)-L-threonylcarbamoyladenosine(37)-C(2))-methylthiotransferase MtaB [Treponema phagedenis]|uniref:tRNA (N(6)-L-threonylcarbamoyladenosine(37)-C(2))- methylthiotransferase MtaB n=1 Tax=Treponema phagedenis TaxID=162 RepID=UPI00046694CE|nr:tRNA (N(6)-L-threonylcarbamoyladenosine(37)-C(2))-methylthiotransferase MtaB [Treponema phagedenis]NVP23932.1 tRNA (N(6)-L-threonylcarbamoyladenosine(37)-C(2))-methylthiotransferase MtaB [Treponema phagedenis]QKS91213.1 tRNA (N(6)-L-threonylcarbamoyladenosine(37)-C(2))-methylthiotransferase MtaB [Treponema phagedenis]QLC59470.1 tRNA (N(6)-L-threonylcarbamoyladenosine(37)-C(2))-methylthiotransferase MtaB [Treponema phagedenis]
MEKLPFFICPETLGCRLNQVESESLAVLFSLQGFQVHVSPQEPDHTILCIVNTCTVTSKAEQKARRLIRLLLQKFPYAVILVTGCYAELEGRTIETIDSRVISFPGKKKDALKKLPKLLYQLLEKNSMRLTDSYIADVSEILQFLQNTDLDSKKDSEMFALSTAHFLFHSRATLKIQDGCNSACAYCRIRFARGKSVSLPVTEVIRRAQAIEDEGFAELVLSGVNLSQYKSEGKNFADVLQQLLDETKKIHIRISSLYPESITPTFLKVAENPRIAPHFHLSIQSGSNAILNAMHRAYIADDIVSVVTALRSIKENPFLGCDIIAGFPGETAEDFEKTLSLCTDLRFTGIHAFPFSARPGTEAAGMKGQVPQRIAGKRVAMLQALAKEHYKDYLAYWDGKTLFAVVEKYTDKPQVLTENYLSLPFDCNEKDLQGKAVIIKVQGNKAELYKNNFY